MGETEKVESLGLLFGKSPEPHQARLFLRQFQLVLRHAPHQLLVEPLRILLVLKADYVIIGESDKRRLTMELLLAAKFEPAVEHVMKIDVRQYR
jgi:hypothetical protein